MYRLENAADRLSSRLVEEIIQNHTDGDSQQIDALIESVSKATADFAAAIRETIIAEVEARITEHEARK